MNDDADRPPRDRPVLTPSLVAVILLLMVLLLVVWPIWRGNGHPGIQHEIYEVPEVETEDDISIGLDVVGTGNIHLTWSSQGEGINYLRSENGGTTWTRPVQLTGPIDSAVKSGSNSLRLKVLDLFVSGDTLVVISSYLGDLLAQTSFDTGISWATPRILIRDIDPDYLDVTRDGRRLYLGFARRDVVLFKRSDDFGTSWAESKALATLDENLVSQTLAIDSHAGFVTIYFLEQFRKRVPSDVPRLPGQPIKPVMVESHDWGRTWGPPEDIVHAFDVGNGDYLRGTRGGIAVTEKFLLSFMGTAGGGLRVSIRPTADRIWGARRRFERPLYYKGRPESIQRGSSIVLALVDIRYAANHWVGYIRIPPLYGGLPWVNNDLFLVTIEPDSGFTETLVTPNLSWVSTSHQMRTTALKTVGNSVFVFWTGRKKVGGGLDTYGFKNQIFFTKLRP